MHVRASHILRVDRPDASGPDALQDSVGLMREVTLQRSGRSPDPLPGKRQDVPFGLDRGKSRTNLMAGGSEASGMRAQAHTCSVAQRPAFHGVERRSKTDSSKQNCVGEPQAMEFTCSHQLVGRTILGCSPTMLQNHLRARGMEQ